MADFTLEARSVLGGFDHDFDGTRLTEWEGMACVAVSVPMGGAEALAKKVKTAFGGSIPKVGQSYVGKGDARVVAFTDDQFFVVYEGEPHGAVPLIEKKLGKTGYYVEQTNNWVALELSGPKAIAALERICAIDMAVFAVDAAERTVMEHMGALVIRRGQDDFLLMSASSTAGSFLHAVETSVKYVS